MPARAPGLYEVARKTPPGFSLLIVCDDGLQARFSVERSTVMVQFGRGARVSVYALHDALRLRSDELIEALCARRVVHGAGRTVAFAARLEPGDRLEDAAESTATDGAQPLDSLAGRVAATDIVDNDTGLILSEPGQRIERSALSRGGWRTDETFPSLLGPFALVEPEHEARAALVFATCRESEGDRLRADLGLGEARAERVLRGELALGPRCRAALDEAFGCSTPDDNLGAQDLVAIWQRLCASR
jgi:hypothetical protein